MRKANMVKVHIIFVAARQHLGCQIFLNLQRGTK